MPIHTIDSSNITKLSEIVLVTYREQQIPEEIEQVILVESSIEAIGFNNILKD